MTEKLKTLKDMKEFSLSHECFEDIKHGVLIDQFVSREQLRQEAIKWIKDFYGTAEDWREIHQPRLRDWMNFFNIEESDLA